MTFAKIDRDGTVVAPYRYGNTTEDGHHDLRNLSDTDLETYGIYRIVNTPRPADTDSTTSDRTGVTFDGATVSFVWTVRPLTDDEQFDRERSEAPDVTDALVAKLNAADIPARWSQPTGAHDAYLPGAVALDASGDRWRNDLGIANVWPFDNLHAKWTNLDAEDPSGPQPWAQPTGASDAYPAIDTNTGKTYRVSHNGDTWDNSHGDGNVWPPGEYGWTAA